MLIGVWGSTSAVEPCSLLSGLSHFSLLLLMGSWQLRPSDHGCLGIGSVVVCGTGVRFGPRPGYWGAAGQHLSLAQGHVSWLPFLTVLQAHTGGPAPGGRDLCLPPTLQAVQALGSTTPQPLLGGLVGWLCSRPLGSCVMSVGTSFHQGT